MSTSFIATSSDQREAPRRRSQTARREESEGRLIEAALHIVAERGVERMTLADVGELAGYSRGLAAHHFGTRGGMLRALVEAVGVSFRKSLAEGPKRRAGLDALTGILEQYFNSIGNMNDFTRAFLVLMTDSSLAGSEVGDSVMKFNQESISFIVAQLRIAKMKGEIKESISAESVAVLILGILRGVMLQQLVDPNSFDYKAVKDQSLLAIHRLLTL